jgi:hypothetical protein
MEGRQSKTGGSYRREQPKMQSAREKQVQEADVENMDGKISGHISNRTLSEDQVIEEKAPFDHRSPHRIEEFETRQRITRNFEGGVEPLKVVTDKIYIQGW